MTDIQFVPETEKLISYIEKEFIKFMLDNDIISLSKNKNIDDIKIDKNIFKKIVEDEIKEKHCITCNAGVASVGTNNMINLSCMRALNSKQRNSENIKKSSIIREHFQIEKYLASRNIDIENIKTLNNFKSRFGDFANTRHIVFDKNEKYYQISIENIQCIFITYKTDYLIVEENKYINHPICIGWVDDDDDENLKALTHDEIIPMLDKYKIIHIDSVNSNINSVAFFGNKVIPEKNNSIEIGILRQYIEELY
ncbi:hypothetical protein HDV06_006565 [Boothiomyces sp. JEL0866]|nr:hypothetical protein HDV06_006565 [Boothiomyces sp. JEL0866]